MQNGGQQQQRQRDNVRMARGGGRMQEGWQGSRGGRGVAAAAAAAAAAAGAWPGGQHPHVRVPPPPGRPTPGGASNGGMQQPIAVAGEVQSSAMRYSPQR
jgi:hypothetical protein